MTDYAIETLDLTKNYTGFKGFREFFRHPFRKKEVPALDGVDLRVKKGEIFGLLGPNGAGKTTLIKVLCTLLMPNSGTAKVNGFDVVEDEQKVRETVGFVNCEERSFFWRLTGRKNLEFFAALHNIEGREAGERVCRVLETVELMGKADELYYTYSSGMKQRLSIARGLLNEPELLLLDDPFTALDPNITRKTSEFIREKISRELGKTVLFATHNLGEVEMLCTSTAVLHGGKICACGKMGDFKKRGGIESVFREATKQ